MVREVFVHLSQMLGMKEKLQGLVTYGDGPGYWSLYAQAEKAVGISPLIQDGKTRGIKTRHSS